MTVTGRLLCLVATAGLTPLLSATGYAGDLPQESAAVWRALGDNLCPSHFEGVLLGWDADLEAGPPALESLGRRWIQFVDSKRGYSDEPIAEFREAARLLLDGTADDSPTVTLFDTEVDRHQWRCRLWRLAGAQGDKAIVADATVSMMTRDCSFFFSSANRMRGQIAARGEAVGGLLPRFFFGGLELGSAEWMEGSGAWDAQLLSGSLVQRIDRRKRTRVVSRAHGVPVLVTFSKPPDGLTLINGALLGSFDGVVFPCVGLQAYGNPTTGRTRIELALVRQVRPAAPGILDGGDLHLELPETALLVDRRRGGSGSFALSDSAGLRHDWARYVSSSERSDVLQPPTELLELGTQLSRAPLPVGAAMRDRTVTPSPSLATPEGGIDRAALSGIALVMAWIIALMVWRRGRRGVAMILGLVLTGCGTESAEGLYRGEPQTITVSLGQVPHDVGSVDVLAHIANESATAYEIEHWACSCACLRPMNRRVSIPPGGADVGFTLAVNSLANSLNYTATGFTSHHAMARIVVEGQIWRPVDVVPREIVLEESVARADGFLLHVQLPGTPAETIIKTDPFCRATLQVSEPAPGGHSLRYEVHVDAPEAPVGIRRHEIAFRFMVEGQELGASMAIVVLPPPKPQLWPRLVVRSRFLANTGGFVVTGPETRGVERAPAPAEAGVAPWSLEAATGSWGESATVFHTVSIHDDSWRDAK